MNFYNNMLIIVSEPPQLGYSKFVFRELCVNIWNVVLYRHSVPVRTRCVREGHVLAIIIGMLLILIRKMSLSKQLTVPLQIIESTLREQTESIPFTIVDDGGETD